MSTLYIPHAEGYKFKCDGYECGKIYQVKNNKHQEISDRLELENFPGNQESGSVYCEDCFKKYEEGGFTERASISNF